MCTLLNDVSMEITMRTKIIVSTVVAFVLGGSPLVVPGDTLSQLVCGIMTALLCCVPLLVLSRFRFLKSAAGSIQTLVAVLICMVALLAMMSLA